MVVRRLPTQGGGGADSLGLRVGMHSLALTKPKTVSNKNTLLQANRFLKFKILSLKAVLSYLYLGKHYFSFPHSRIYFCFGRQKLSASGQPKEN